jgi:hypothetical protein
MSYVQITSYSGPPAQITVSDWPAETVFYTYPGYITNVDNFPFEIALPSPDFDSVFQISLSAYSDSGCLVVLTDTCASGPATPTPTALVDCSYILFETNDNFVTSGTVDYLDCYGVQGTYTATTSGQFGLCVQSASTSLEIDIIDDSSYDCTYFEGIWYPPNIPTPTMTPTQPVTPTPTAADLGFYEVLLFPYNNTSAVSRAFNLRLRPTSGSVFGPLSGPLYVDWGDGSPIQTITGGATTLISRSIVAGDNGTIRVSGKTTTVGEVQSIREFSLFDGNSYVTDGGPYVTVAMTELAKLKGLIQSIGSNSESGNISALSSTPAKILRFAKNATGDIGTLPNTVNDIFFDFTTTIYGNTNNLPDNINKIHVNGTSRITGDTSSFVGQYTALTNTLYLNGNSNISGLMSELPNCTYIGINGLAQNTTTAQNIDALLYTNSGSTISGPLTFKSNNQYVYIYGRNTISGDFSTSSVPTQLMKVALAGLNTISGNLNTLKLPTYSFILAGNNTATGNLSSINAPNIANLQSFVIAQQGNISSGATDISVNTSGCGYGYNLLKYNTVSSGNTITGNINFFQNAPALTELYVGGRNTLNGNFGDLINLDNLGSFINISSQNVVFTSTFSNPNGALFNGGYSIILKNSSAGMSASAVDGLFNYLGNKITGAEPNCTPTGIKCVTITGSGNAAPTAASSANRNKINYCYGDVITN